MNYGNVVRYALPPNYNGERDDDLNVYVVKSPMSLFLHNLRDINFHMIDLANI